MKLSFSSDTKSPFWGRFPKSAISVFLARPGIPRARRARARPVPIVYYYIPTRVQSRSIKSRAAPGRVRRCAPFFLDTHEHRSFHRGHPFRFLGSTTPGRPDLGEICAFPRGPRHGSAAGSFRERRFFRGRAKISEPFWNSVSARGPCHGGQGPFSGGGGIGGTRATPRCA